MNPPAHKAAQPPVLSRGLRAWRALSTPLGAGALIAVVVFVLLFLPAVVPLVAPSTESSLIRLAEGTLIALIGIAGGGLNWLAESKDSAKSSVGTTMLHLAFWTLASTVAANVFVPWATNKMLQNLAYGAALWATLAGMVAVGAGFGLWLAADEIVQKRRQDWGSLILPLPDQDERKF